MNRSQWPFLQHLGLFAVASLLVHVGFMGYKGWTTPEKWSGGMPPITLVAATVILLMLMIRGLNRFRSFLTSRMLW